MKRDLMQSASNINRHYLSFPPWAILSIVHFVTSPIVDNVHLFSTLFTLSLCLSLHLFLPLGLAKES